MCSCTSDNPFECNMRAYGHDGCTCSYHRHWKVPQGYKALAPHNTHVVLDKYPDQCPKQPLEEKDAEIERLRLENEHLHELIAIVDAMLYHDAVSGEWPNEQCRYCGGHSSGYWDSQAFVHSDECAVEKMRTLRK